MKNGLTDDRGRSDGSKTSAPAALPAVSCSPAIGEIYTRIIKDKKWAGRPPEQWEVEDVFTSQTTGKWAVRLKGISLNRTDTVSQGYFNNHYY